MNLRAFFAYEPLHTDSIRLEKFTIFLVAVSCCVAAVVWTAMYYYVFGFGLVTTLPFLFFAIVALWLIVCHFIRNHQPLVYIQIHHHTHSMEHWRRIRFRFRPSLGFHRPDHRPDIFLL